ncbi:hypothetical protein M885DRAFT_400793, partial [Pelagophyceae sp. CCMP2097]
DAPNDKHCTKCKSRHYCSKACQLVYWKRGHNKACRQLAAEFQDRLLDELMPKKKQRRSRPSDDAPSWRVACAICLDVLPIEGNRQTFYSCCCKTICTVCHVKCNEYDERCPLCRSPPPKSADEWLRRMQKHVDKGNAEAQIMLGSEYRDGGMGIQQNFKRAVQLYERAAAQGHAIAQSEIGFCYALGEGVKIDLKTAALWYRRAAAQGFPRAQCHLGNMFHNGRGVAQSDDEAAKWFRLAAAQGEPDALFNLGACYANGHGVPQDFDEALRFYKRA